MKNGKFRSIECIFYFATWISAILYAIWEIVAARKVFDGFNDVYGDFKDGWPALGRRKDSADYEWEFGLETLAETAPWLAVHLAVSETLRQAQLKGLLPYFHVVLSGLYLFRSLGLVPFLFVAVQPVAFYFIGKCKCRKRLWSWACAAAFLGLITYVKTSETAKTLLALSEKERHVLAITVCWMNLRCLSCSLDNEADDFVGCAGYSLYLPTLVFGPFVARSAYAKIHGNHQERLWRRFAFLAVNILRFLAWIVAVEIFLHYAYINALAFQVEIVQKLGIWALYGYGYSMGQFFHVKYVIFYGLTTAVAQFDGIPTPALPKCIGRIHLYSDMWKHFDRGLYRFLIKYIYLPTLRHRETLADKTLSSLLCFAFVYVWHGTEAYVLVWAALNYLGVVCENLFAAVCATAWVRARVRRGLSAEWEQRIGCALASPLLAVSAVSNFFFFAGTDVGNVFVRRFVSESVAVSATVLAVLYCCCQVSTEIKKWEARKANLEPKRDENLYFHNKSL